MSVKRTRRKPQDGAERRVSVDAGKETEEAVQGRKTELRTVDDISLETQRRSIAYSRARGLV